jgi:phenylacetate-CoA ligase
MAELEIFVEVVPEAPADTAVRVARELADAFTLRIPVQCVAAGSLPRFEFKSRRWVKR